MSVKCEQPLDELTVQVWLLYFHPNFKYCTLFASGTELRTDDPITRCLRQTFQAGGIKKMFMYYTIMIDKTSTLQHYSCYQSRLKQYKSPSRDEKLRLLVT